MFLFKRFALIFTVLMLAVMTCTPAFAASIYNWDYENEVRHRGDKSYVLTNKVTLVIGVSRDTDDVIVDGEEDRGYWDSGYYVVDVSLDPGENRLELEAVEEEDEDEDEDEDDDGDNETEEITIHYMHDNIPGSRYVIDDLTEASSDQELFGGAINIELPGRQAVMNGDLPASSQEVQFEVARAQIKPPQGDTASNIFSFTGEDTAYNTAPGTRLTFEYDSGISNTEANMLTVLRMIPALNPQLGIMQGAQNIGGAVDTSDKTISVTVPGNAFGHYVVVKKSGDFEDFYRQGGSHSSVSSERPYVLTLWAKGVMSPLEEYPGGGEVQDGYFGLLKPGEGKEVGVTRKELASMLVKGLRIPRDALAAMNSSYRDLGGLSIEERIDIESATRSGLFTGKPGEKSTQFNPGEIVTRQEAAVVLARASGARLPASRGAERALENYFEDYNDIERWMCPYIMAAVQRGLVTSEDQGRFRPTEPFTRVEAARSVYRLMQRNGYL